jgi:hypothetical protein
MSERRYYSSRTKRVQLSLSEIYFKFQHIYLYFMKKDYFKEKAGIYGTNLPEEIKHKAGFSLKFQPFPITKWAEADITEDNLFDVLEFLYDHVSQPGEYGDLTTDTGFNYQDYINYDEAEGKKEYREKINTILADYKQGYKLSEEGQILAIGSHGLDQILDADIPAYDDKNVDSKVRSAVRKWRNRHLDMSEKKQAIVELADVFEWLRKTKKLEKALSKKGESALFEIANNFGIRHHNPNQKSDYDKDIWYAWIFHFYLATYHAAIRIIKRKESHAKQP